MKRQRLCLFLAIAFGGLLLSSYSEGPFFYGAGNRTGAAGSPIGCSEAKGCHASASINAVLGIQLFDSLDMPVNRYQPGSTYRVFLSELVPGNTRPRFGFQTSVVKASDGSTQAGTLNPGLTPDIAVYNAPPQLIEHTSALAGTPSGADILDTVSFLWTAPGAGFGRVRLYAVLNAVNYDGDSTGDRWRATTAEFDPVPSSVAGQSAAAPWRLFPNPAHGALRIEGVDRLARIDVLDASGRGVAHSEADAAGAAALNLNELPEGRYFLRSSAGGLATWRSFLKE
jgi:hypothetical protein